MVSASRLADLQAAGKDYVDCPFVATGILGQGEGTVQSCNLTPGAWTGTKALNFTIQSVDSPLNIGADSGIGSTLPIIDDFQAAGILRV